MWVRAFRGFNHSGQDTTSAAEGFHFSLKHEAKASRRGLKGRDLPWLLQLIYDTLEPKYTFGQMLKCSGAVVNKRSEAAVRKSIEAARDIPAGSVTVLCAQRGNCSVVSCTQAPLEHVIEDALGDDPHCSCAAGSQGSLCKHIVRCIVLLGRSEREIQLLHGSLKGMELPDGTVPKLHRGIVSGGAERHRRRQLQHLRWQPLSPRSSQRVSPLIAGQKCARCCRSCFTSANASSCQVQKCWPQSMLRLQ